MTQVRREQIKVAQVIEQDDEWVTLRVAKSDETEYDVEAGQFWFVLFVKPDGKGGMVAEYPWEREPEDR